MSEETLVRKGKKINLKGIFIGLAAVLGIVLAVSIFLTSSISNELKKAAEDSREKIRPARIELALIKNSQCKDCTDISSFISAVKKSNVNVTNEKTVELNSNDAKALINKYKIEKIPAFIVTGEIDRLNLQGLEKKQNALLLAAINPPYTNAATGKIEGHIALYKLTAPECGQCSDLLGLLAQIKQGGVKISAEKSIAADSAEGKELIQKYKIGFVPTLILSKDLQPYTAIEKAWHQVGTKESDGSYVLRLPNPPFINLTNGRLMGLVTMTYLLDKSCPECSDAGIYKRVLEDPKGFAVSFDKEEKLDISDAKAKELVSRYNITQVPAVILSGEVDVYPSKQALKQFFSVEKDGSYVFRKVSVLGNYKDLTTNQIVSKSASKSKT